MELPADWGVMLERLFRKRRAEFSTLQGWMGPRRFEGDVTSRGGREEEAALPSCGLSPCPPRKGPAPAPAFSTPTPLMHAFMKAVPVTRLVML